MEGVKRSYSASLQMLLGHRLSTALTIVVVVGLAAMAGGLFMVLPKELVPNEDRGRVDLSIQGPEGAGFDYTLRAVHQAEPYFESLRQKGGVLTDYLFAVPAFGNAQYNTGFGTTVMSGQRKRALTADDLAAQINKKMASITSVQFVATGCAARSRAAASRDRTRRLHRLRRRLRPDQQVDPADPAGGQGQPGACASAHRLASRPRTPAGRYRPRQGHRLPRRLRPGNRLGAAGDVRVQNR